jgi:hypothetical protein
MRPTGQCLDAVEPGGDVLVVRRNVKAEFLRRVVEVADERQVGDRWLRTDDVGAAGEPLVEYAEHVVDPALEEFQHRRMAGRFRQRAQEAVRTEIAADLLIVEDDPAQRFEAVVLAARLEFSGALGEIGQDHAGLGQPLRAMNEHGSFAHLVDVGAVAGGALNAAGEEVDEHRLPVGADQLEHQRRPIGVARLRKAVELIFGHPNPLRDSRPLARQ